MLKFFRKIRQQLLSENHFSKYFLYAFGEILLVMIGILLALQVNNWNQNRLNHLKTHEILREIKRNVKENIKSTQENIAEEKAMIQSADIIFNNLNHIKEYHDSLDFHFQFSHLWPEVSIKSSGYETLKNNGIDLIQSDILKEAIVNLYEVAYNEIAEVTRTSEGYSFSMMGPTQTDLFLVDSGELSASPFDYQKVLNSEKYKGVLSYWKGLRYYAVGRREKANVQSEQLLILINKELKEK